MARFHHREEAIERLQLTVERDKHMLQGLEQGYELLDHTPEEVKQRIAINEFILENGLTPLNSPHEMKATNFLTQLINYPWILAILIALALLSIDIFSGDVEGGAYKNLYSQPIARGKIYAAKYLIRFFYSFVVIIGVTALVLGSLPFSTAWAPSITLFLITRHHSKALKPLAPILSCHGPSTSSKPFLCSASSPCLPCCLLAQLPCC
jgi:hypothetical protein